jgi:tetratricopeptide (TPR) repeat protein
VRKEDYSKALADLDKVIELNGELAEAYYARGLLHEHSNRLDKAVEDYTRALEIDPGYTDAFNQRKNALSRKKSA